MGLFFIAYVLGCGFAQSLAIVPGTGISVWPPSGLFLATLVLAPRHTWPWWVLAGCLAELLGNYLWFHSPLPAALLIYLGNALEGVVGAWLVNRFCGRPVRLETLHDVLALVVMGAGIAPAISATVGSATLAGFAIQSQAFTTAWPLWWIGDATGALLVAPPALFMLQNWRGKARLSAAQWTEAGFLALIFLGAAALSLSGHYLPFAYIIMPPLLWAAARFEFKGVAVTLTLLALITAAFSLSGASQFTGDPEAQKQKQIVLQLFLAISAFSALIVAAISRQRQQALLSLREREGELSLLVDMMPSHLWRLTPDGEPTYFNKRMVDFLGPVLSGAGKPGRSRLEAVLEAIHPDDAPAFSDTLDYCLLTGEHFSLRYRLRRADGVYRWMSSRAEPMRDQSGKIVQWYGFCHDIDDLVATQETLHTREGELSLLVDMVPSHIWRVTPDGETTLVNKHMVDYLGEDWKVRWETAMDTIVHPDDVTELADEFGRCLSTGDVFAMKYRLRRIDGVYRWMSGRAEPMRDEDGQIVQWFGLCHDIDDQVRAEEDLRRTSDKLARATQASSLAELSASIAHEVNQPLAAIVANSHACHRWLSADPPNVERAKLTAERITRDANSAADVVSRVRALFKQSAEMRTSTSLSGIVAEARLFLSEEATRRRVSLEFDVEGDIPAATLDRVQVQQVLINLMRNGMEAMEVTSGDRVLRTRLRWIGSVVQTEISDRGPGIEFPERIFEPFFTTKEDGMGMGLAICRSIIESHGGRLWAENGVPNGATFIFTLPIELKTTS